MRPASDVARDCGPYWWVETNDRQSLEECAAVIQRDREEVVREIVEMICDRLDMCSVVVVDLVDQIERKFLKGAASDA